MIPANSSYNSKELLFSSWHHAQSYKWANQLEMGLSHKDDINSVALNITIILKTSTYKSYRYHTELDRKQFFHKPVSKFIHEKAVFQNDCHNYAIMEHVTSSLHGLPLALATVIVFVSIYINLQHTFYTMKLIHNTTLFGEKCQNLELLPLWV